VRAVFIAALGHSGSTLLDLMLGSHPRLLSLGEVHATLSRFGEPQNACTCGAAADACPFWGPLREAWRREPRRPYPELYDLVLERARERFGADVAPVDSSKHLAALEAMSPQQRRGLKVLFLVKDVRGFAASLSDRGSRAALRSGLIPLHVARWWLGNRRLERYLAREGLERLTVGYEELCFRPESILREACAFLGLPFHESMLRPGLKRAHVLRGNRMRFDRERSSRVDYDARWMARSRTMWAAPWFLPAMPLNRRLVWSRLLAQLREERAPDRGGGSGA
jgi:hypothetical protein